MSELKFRVTVDDSEFNSKMRDIRGQVSNTSAAVDKEGRKMDSTFSRLTAAAAAFFTAQQASQIISNIARVRGEFQQLEVAFTTMLGSRTEASKLMSEAVQFAAVTPFDLKGVADGIRMMLAYGTAAEDAIKEIEMLGNVAAGLSVPLNDIVYLYGTLRAQGRAYAVDIRQFAGRGVPIYEELSKVLGVTVSQVNELISAGKVGFPEVEQAFRNMTSEGGMFYNLMKEQSKTIVGQISNLRDSIDMMFNEIGKSNEGIIGDVISGAAYMVEHYQSVLSILKTLVITYGAYRAALILTAAVQNALNIAQLAKGFLSYARAVGVATAATKTFNKALKSNIFGLIAAAIAGLISVISSFVAKQREAREAAEEALLPLQEEYTKVNDLVGKIQDANTEEGKRIELLNELKELAPEVAEGITSEADSIAELTTRLEAYNNQQLAEMAVKRYGLESGFVESVEAVKDAKRNLDAETAALYNTYYEFSARFAELRQANKLTHPSLIVGVESVLNDTSLSVGEKMQKLVGVRYKKLRQAFDKADKPLDQEVGLLFNGLNIYEYNKALVEASIAENEYVRNAEKLKEQIKGIAESTIPDAEQRQSFVQSMLESYGLVEPAPIIKKEKEEEDEELTAEQIKEAEKRAKAIADAEAKMRRENEDATIAAIENETLRELEALRVKHNREIEELNRQRDALMKLQGGTLTPEQEALYTQSINLKNESYERESARIAESPVIEALKAQNEELQRLYTEYKSLISQYEEADARFAQERKMLERDGASGDTLATLDAKREETLNAISTEMAMQNNAFQTWADNLVDMSLEQLQQALTRANQMLTLTEDLSPNSSGRAAQYRAQAAALQEEIDKRKKDKKGGDSPDKEAESDWKELNRVIGDSAEIFEEVGEQIGGVGGAAVSAAGVVAASTISIINGLTQVVGASAASLSAVEKASVILAVISAVVQAVTKLTSMFAADYEQYNRLKEQYEGLVEVWDKLIERKREYIGIEYGTESLKAAEDTLRVLEKQVEATRQIARERLRSGASAGSHSIGYRMWEGSYKFNGQTWSDVAANIESITGEQFNNIEDLTRMSADSLLYIMENYAGLWAVMDDDVREYLENIIEYSDTSKDIIDETKEALTGITFDDMYNDFLDKLMDMENDTQSFADDVTETLTRAMLNASIENLYKGKLQDWYEEFYANIQDGQLTSAEIADLRKDYQEIVDAALAERDALASITGYDKIAAEIEEQQATAGAFSTMSEDTGTKLDGRFAALQMASESIKEDVTATLVAVDNVLMIVTNSNTILQEMRNIMLIEAGYLEDIARYAKQMLGYGDKLDAINTTLLDRL